MIFLDIDGNLYDRATGQPLQAPAQPGNPPVKDMTTRTTAATWEQPSPKPKAALASQVQGPGRAQPPGEPWRYPPTMKEAGGKLPPPKKYDFKFGEEPMYDMPKENPVINMQPEQAPKEMYLSRLKGQAQEMLRAGIDPSNVHKFYMEGMRQITLANPPKMHDPIMEWIHQWKGVPTRAEAPKKEGEA